jgi:hypothetical protein
LAWAELARVGFGIDDMSQDYGYHPHPRPPDPIGVPADPAGFAQAHPTIDAQRAGPSIEQLVGAQFGATFQGPRAALTQIEAAIGRYAGGRLTTGWDSR